jgi:hypothetical protein
MEKQPQKSSLFKRQPLRLLTNAFGVGVAQEHINDRGTLVGATVKAAIQTLVPATYLMVEVIRHSDIASENNVAQLSSIFSLTSLTAMGLVMDAFIDWLCVTSFYGYGTLGLKYIYNSAVTNMHQLAFASPRQQSRQP